jgi:hypothetical protein
MKHVAEILPAVVQPEMIAPLTPIQQRLLTMPVQDEPDDVLYSIRERLGHRPGGSEWFAW